MTIRDPSSRKASVFVSRLLMVVSIVSLALGSAGCKDKKTDVTNDPSHGNFSSVVGTWKTKVPLILKEIDKELYLDTRSALFGGSDRHVATLPVGTEIRIEHLIREETIEITQLHPTGSLILGPYANRTIEIDPTLFVPNRFPGFNPGTTTQPSVPLGSKWAVAPEVLGK